MDFALNKDADYNSLKKLTDGLDISILINNVGLSHSIPVPFIETPKQEMNDIIMINCMATLRVTQLITPGMVSRQRGLVLTMASFGGFFPTPLLATYSGSMASMFNVFSRILLPPPCRRSASLQLLFPTQSSL
jgi:17beta-estradiol 17-dehydrogenase / very-long-chain 3-oxoacyl-CoA reductase